SEIARISKGLYDDRLITFWWSADETGKIIKVKGGRIEQPGIRQIEHGTSQLGRPSVVYNLHGHNTRVNVGSVDSSVNVVDVSTDKLFADLKSAVQLMVASEKEEILRIVDQMSRAAGDPPKYARLYSKLIGLAADHMTLIGPFIPALSQLLSST